MWLLVGLGHHTRFVVPEVFAVVRERVLGPGPPDNIERLGEALPTLRVRHAILQICPRKAAATDPKDESTVADVVNGGGLLGDPERMTQRQDLDRGTDLDMAGARAIGGREQHGRGQHGAFWREVELR